jgi:LPXTG-motif cell wall-anchored protein
VKIPEVSGMDLKDYQDNRIGHAIGWYEDYPNGDRSYNNRDTQYVDEIYKEVTIFSDVIRYRVADAAAAAAEDGDDSTGSSTGRKVQYKLNATATTAEIKNYICLTVGYEISRYELTVTAEASGAATSTATFNFTVEIKGNVSESATVQTNYPEAILHVFKCAEDSAVQYTSTEISDDQATDGKGSAKVEFTLKAGESVTLRGIPVNANVVITENDADDYVTTYQLGTADSENGTEATIEKITENSEVTFNNFLGYTLPSTGGSGTLIYTISGMVLCATAVVFWNRRRRRAH